MVNYFIDNNVNTPSDKDRKFTILVICDHPILGKAIETGLKSLARIDILYTHTEKVSTTEIVGRMEQASLVVFSLLHREGTDRHTTTDDFVRASGWQGSPPILIISEESLMHTLDNPAIHFLRFPFDINKLQKRVGEILEGTSHNVSMTSTTPSQTRLLIVEDESIVAADLRRTLERVGFDVLATIGWAEKAIDFVRTTPPDVILMDIHLRGEMDGIQAANIIQTEMDVPIIYLTSHSDTATLERAQLTAPYGYVLKPYDERELLSAIQVALYRAKAERSIRARERWLRAILNAIGDGIIATNAQGRVAFLNPVAESLIASRWDDILNRSLDESLKTEPASNNQATNSDITEPKREVLHITHDEADRVIDQTRSPIFNERGEFWGEIRALRDVTEDMERRDLLQHQKDELIRQNEELTAFAHTVAHDIKDPLHVIRGYAELLTSDDIDLDAATQQKSLDIIVGYTKRIANIVEELLLLSTVRESEVKTEPLFMGEILSRAEERLSYMVSQSGAVVTYSVQDWPVGLGHAAWVEEVWVNYLSNAIKYGGTPPEVSVGADKMGDSIRYWVRDNGTGITPEDQEKLFIPFSRLHQVRVTGQGLGLSIVRRILSRLSGDVGVESQVGYGSTFFFTLPAAPLHQVAELRRL